MHHIYSLLISITTQHKAPHFSFNSPCACVHSKSACASVCKYVFFLLQYSYFFIFYFSINFCQFTSVSLFVCLFGCYSAPLIIFGKCLDCYCQFRCCDTTVIFINHHPSLFFLFFHLSIGGEFKTFSSSGMVYSCPFVVWVSRLR